jgi:hypothetical protein
MSKTTQEKAESLKMLAETVRNTPGAVQVEPIRDTHVNPSRSAWPRSRVSVRRPGASRAVDNADLGRQ